MYSTSQNEPADFTWTDAFLLGFGQIDEIHREFVDIVAAMLRSSDADFLHSLDDFVKHATAHFGEEDTWMNDTDFPARECHIAEHAAVMKSTLEVRQLVEDGNIAIGRAFTTELTHWFPGHATYLDSALAHWMFKRQHGGKPIVFRRDVSSHTS